MKRTAIVWFRQDLRLHDNEALAMALRMADEVIPVYIFDTRTYTGTTRFGFPKTGRFRARFVLESVADLRQNMRKLGSDLVLRCGRPEYLLPEIARQTRASWIFCNRERTDEEVRVQDALEQKLWEIGVELLYSRGKMLYHTQDLPVPVHHTPDNFTQFRKENEPFTPVRAPFPAPTRLNRLPSDLPPGDLPALSDFGHQDFDLPQGAFVFRGGESAGLQRLQYYLWESDHIANYKNTRNGLLGSDFSSRLSPWLAQGCLSPKTVYHEIKRYESERMQNESTYWLTFELLWRDFFRLMGKKHGNRIFRKGGPQQRPLKHLKNNTELFNLWSEGRTGVPFIDANMRELNATGWMSNRGRQNTAAFLVQDLKVNWQMGAEYFESLLIDYDPCSNWGNWNYVAGVGSDPREDRYFNILTQARNYDPSGAYVKAWCPELAAVPEEIIHRPDLLNAADRARFGVNGYPKSVVRIEKWTR